MYYEENRLIKVTDKELPEHDGKIYSIDYMSETDSRDDRGEFEVMVLETDCVFILGYNCHILDEVRFPDRPISK